MNEENFIFIDPLQEKVRTEMTRFVFVNVLSNPSTKNLGHTEMENLIVNNEMVLNNLLKDDNPFWELIPCPQSKYTF